MQDVNGRLISGFYKSSPRENPTLSMSIRTVDGKKKFINGIDSPVKPYFYIDEKDRDTADKALIMSGLSKLDFKFTDPKMSFGMRPGKPLKCEMWEPWRIVEIRDYFKKTFNIEADEADVMYMRRVLIDKNIKAGISIKDGEISPYNGGIPSPRLLFLDTEIDDSNGFPEEPGEYSILCAGTTDDKGVIKYFSWKFGDSTEAQMLEDLYNYALQYDYLVVWNKDFDEKHIVKRCKKLGLNLEWRFFRWVDLAELHRKYYQKTYYEKLHVAYHDILKKFKSKLTKKGIKIRDEQITRLKGYYKIWFVKPDLLKDVNTSHAYALYVMEKAMDVINLYSQVADEVGIFIDYTVYNSHIVDTYALRLIKENNLGWVIPSLKKYEKRIGYRGAIVSAPVKGVHSFVYLYDFTSLYNNVIQSYLLDPICYQKWEGTFTENGIDSYIKYARSFGEICGIDGLPLFPAILQRLEKSRNEYKKQRSNYEHGSVEYEEYEQKQKAAKAVLLSTYGVLGMSSSRWVINKPIPLEMMLVIKDEDVEEADYRVPNVPEEKFVGMVTHIAREALMGATEYLKKDENINVLYGDTDSSYIAPFNLIDKEKTYRNLTQEDTVILESFGISCGEKLEKYFSESFEAGIEMKLEKIFDRALFGSAKKNYYCRVIYDEDTGWQFDENGKLTWYEYVKGLPLVRTDRTEFLQMFQRKIFQEILDNPDMLYKICEEIVRDFYQNKYDHMLIIKSAMKKPINQYKTKTLATQAAQKLIERGESVRAGEKIHLIVTDIVKETEVIDGKKKTKYVKVIEPIDDSISPEEAVAKLPPLGKKALDYYWDNRIWKNIEPFLYMVLDESEIKKIRFLKERKTSLDQFMVGGSGGE